MNDKELIAEARQEESIHDKLGDGFSEGSEERAFYYGHRDRYGRLADALEAAGAERDAALSRIAELEQSLGIEALARRVNGTLLHEYEQWFA